LAQVIQLGLEIWRPLPQLFDLGSRRGKLVLDIRRFCFSTGSLALIELNFIATAERAAGRYLFSAVVPFSAVSRHSGALRRPD
jgi:hypothetical protein